MHLLVMPVLIPLTYTDANGCVATQDYIVTVNSASITPFVNTNGGGFVEGTSVVLCEGGFFDLGTQAGRHKIIL